MCSQADRQANLLADCLSSLKSWKDLIEEHLEGDDKATELENVREMVLGYCQIDFDAKKSGKAANEVVDYFNDDTNEPSKSVDELYKEILTKDESVLENIEQSRIWKEVMLGDINTDVEEVEQQSQAAATEYEEMQDSIYYSNVFTPPVDPISKEIIKDPVKSGSCGHVYENKYIRQYIKSMKNKAKCPYIGCSNRNLTIRELVEDKTTKEKIENYLTTQNAHSSESSNED